jgi:uncharacterized protein (UPF0147 family)
MASNVGFNVSNIGQSLFQGLNKKIQDSESQTSQSFSSLPSLYNNTDGDSLLMNSLNAMATQNGMPVNNANAQTTQQITEMLAAGNKEEVKDMGAQAVPSLMAIVKDTSQPMNVRVDAIATLAKLVDEGKAPASCLVQLLKDPNSKDMAERALANVGKEAMPAVKQLLKSGDPEMQQSAKNILNDMKDAWAGYENDPKWGQECQELMPEVDKLLNEVGQAEETAKTGEIDKQQNVDQQTIDPQLLEQLMSFNPESDPDQLLNQLLSSQQQNNNQAAGLTRQYADYSKILT